MKLYNIISSGDNKREIIGQAMFWERGEGGETIGEEIYANMDIVAEVGKKVYPEWRVGEYDVGLVEICVYEKNAEGITKKIHKKTLYKQEIDESEK